MSDNIGLDVEVQLALKSALKILIDLAADADLNFPLLFEPVNRDPLEVKCVVNTQCRLRFGC
jgi:hypothetical protein